MSEIVFVCGYNLREKGACGRPIFYGDKIKSRVNNGE